MITTKPKKEMTLQEAHRHAGRMHMINISVQKSGDNIAIKQTALNTWNILTVKELEEKAEQFYSLADESVKIKGEPLVFDLDLVTVEWVQEKLKELGIKPKELREQTHTDPSFFSQVMNGKAPFSRQLKTLFFYYIVAMDTGQRLRGFARDKDRERLDFFKKYRELEEKYRELEEKYLSLTVEI